MVPFTSNSAPISLVAPGVATALGTDIKCFPDLDPAFSIEAGNAAVASSIARRLQTPRGGLFYDPDYGYDIRDALSDVSLGTNTAAIQSNIERECEKDERVQAVTASVTYIQATSTLKVSVALVTSAGPFNLVLQVKGLSVSVLPVNI